MGTTAAPPPLRSGDCHVWWAAPENRSGRVDALLNASELARLSALRRGADRDRFSVACGLLRVAAGGYLGLDPAAVEVDRTCPSCGRQHGRPRLAAGAGLPLELSVSHSGGRIVVAVALGTPVGVDVERVDARLADGSLGPSVLAPEELPVLEAAATGDRPRVLLAYWTRKEAVLKAVGLGLRVAPASFAVTRPDEPPGLLRWPDDPDLPRRVVMYEPRPQPGHVASLAVIGGSGRVTELDGSAALRALRA